MADDEKNGTRLGRIIGLLMDSVIDTVVDDFLGPLRLKPWWESWREYAYRGSLALILLYSVYDINVFNCLPMYVESNDYADTQAAAVDSFCMDKSIPWYFTYGDLAASVVCIGTYIIANSWLHINGVKDTLIDMSTFAHGILDMNLSNVEMANAIVLPLTASSTEEHRLLRRSVRINDRCFTDLRVLSYYSIRCILVCVWAAIGAVLTLLVSVGDIGRTSTKICEVNGSLLELGLVNSSTSYVCVDKTSSKIASLGVLFAITLIVQSFLMGIALRSQKITISRTIPRLVSGCNKVQPDADTETSDNNGKDNRRNCDEHGLDDVQSFLSQMMGVHEKEKEKIKFVINFLNSREFPDKMKRKSKVALVAGDEGFFRILQQRLLPEKFWQHVKATAVTVLDSVSYNYKPEQDDISIEELTDLDFKVSVFFEKLLSSSKNNVNDLYSEITRQWYWNLSMCIAAARRSISIKKYDALDVKGRSCLFYMLRRSTMDNYSNRFIHFNESMKATISPNIKLVHFDGKSMTPQDFFYYSYTDQYRGLTPDFELCHTNTTQEMSNECDAELEGLFQEYTKHSDQRSSTLWLIRIKLTNLNTTCAKNFAEEAIRCKHWEVLVALLNTFIILHPDGKRPDNHCLMGDDIFDLNKNCKLEDIFKVALKNPRNQRYYVATAAEHLLSIAGGDTKKELMNILDQTTMLSAAKRRLQGLSQKFNAVSCHQKK